MTAIGWFIVNIQSDLFWHRCLERQTFGTPRMYTLSPSKSIKGSNYGEFLKDKNALLCTRLYKYAPNLESLLTQQYVCVMCTLWSDNTCVFIRFHSVKNQIRSLSGALIMSNEDNFERRPSHPGLMSIWHVLSDVNIKMGKSKGNKRGMLQFQIWWANIQTMDQKLSTQIINSSHSKSFMFIDVLKKIKTTSLLSQYGL